MNTIDPGIVDQRAYRHATARAREAGIRLPRISELADPERIPQAIRTALAAVDPDAPHPLNLFRVHWHNAADRRGLCAAPEHLVLTEALTGVAAPIIVVLGNRFPLIAAHKVLAAYGCLAPRLVSGRFDHARQRAVWPSTGNYCRGGVAISRILDCRAVAVLPEGMSRERFAWLERWVSEPGDIVRTPGSESNVKEIYDACAGLARDPDNVILNQFSEFGNYIVHRAVTGPALERAFEAVRGGGRLRARAFVSASGSAGTLAAGDHLKQALGARICVLEALECPTLLYNGYGEHNIQGIGDKHVPLIHNVFNTDFAAAISERGPETLSLLFNSEIGRRYLVERRGVAADLVVRLGDLGLSSIANLLGAIKLARYLDLGADEAVLSVATDGAVLYESERDRILRRDFAGHFDEIAAAEVHGRYLQGAATDHLLELGHRDRERIFNLGYYTWVEQQGVALADFDARRDPEFWEARMAQLADWDAAIDAFNATAAQ